ncbi:hypothetical protein J7K55_03025 [Candidatus Aerophobetes bacterium]|nr:hypothetical protein [Candidatus Aerophobetes bacterium]
MKDSNIPGYVNSIGVCGMVFFTEYEISNYRSFVKYFDVDRLTRLWFELMNNGIWISPCADEHWTISV